MGVKTYRYELVRGETLGKAYDFFDTKTGLLLLGSGGDLALIGKVIYHVEDNIVRNEDMPDCSERNRGSSLVTRTIFFRDAD